MPVQLFPFSEYLWLYGLFTVLVLAVLAIDLGVFHREAHVVSFREASTWSVVWVALSLAINFSLYRYAAWEFPQDERLMGIDGFDPRRAARRVALEFLTGYIVEYSLSIDNIFVFVIVFRYFGIPAMYQHRVLFYGILGALVFRALFITTGALLIRYHWVVVGFGVFLIITGLRMMFLPEKEVDPEKNFIIRLFRRRVPVTAGIHGQKFFVRVAGVTHATPLFITLLFLEMTDIVFAIDSVPAIFALTREPLIVFTSNICAILGLRAMYFMLAGAIDKFHMLKYGISIVLIFVGLKMTILNDLFGGQFPITISLPIIAGVIAGSVALSLLLPKGETTVKGQD
jgi:tellurite resistance protein TerC